MSESLKRWYSKKKSNSKHRGIEFNLSIDEVKQLMDDAGIDHTMTGTKKGKYVLARKNEITGEVDTGIYEMGNCRFILWEENIAESSVRQVSRDRQNALIRSGKHMFCDSELQRQKCIKTTKRRLEDGTHNFLGVLPWNNINVKNNPIQLKMWKMMPELYAFWNKEGKPRWKTLSKKIYEVYGFRCRCNSLVSIFDDDEKYAKMLNDWRKVYVE